MSSSTIHKSIFIHAPRERVWSFLTDKDKLGRWYHPAGDHLQVGKDYTLYEDEGGERKPIVWGRVIDMDAPSLLVTTFTVSPFNGQETTLTWTLETIADGTRLSITHSGVEEAVEGSPISLLMALDKGWDKHFARLRQQF